MNCRLSRLALRRHIHTHRISQRQRPARPVRIIPSLPSARAFACARAADVRVPQEHTQGLVSRSLYKDLSSKIMADLVGQAGTTHSRSSAPRVRLTCEACRHGLAENETDGLEMDCIVCTMYIHAEDPSLGLCRGFFYMQSTCVDHPQRHNLLIRPLIGQ
jgi:hypothetical protein